MILQQDKTSLLFASNKQQALQVVPQHNQLEGHVT
jgi:hypothetical protein